MEVTVSTRNPRNDLVRFSLLFLILSIGRYLPGSEVQPSEAGAGEAAPRGSLKVDCDYPGGNILVDRIEGDTVHVRQDLRDTAGWWFYWNFRVAGAGGRTLRFQFSGQSPIGVRGPAVSSDGGRSWSWLGAAAVKGSSFSYTFAAGAGEVRFAFAIPYQVADLERFLEAQAGDPHLAAGTLCKSRKGRPVMRLNAGKLHGEPAHRVLVTARHHACECMASYVLEGLLAGVLAETEDGRWFQENVEVLAIPFADTDGVEDGDQGKNRKPRDHNRDYAGESIYPEVRAIRKLVPEWSQGLLRVAFDLHCPWIRGRHNDVIYMVGSADERNWGEQQKLGRILEASRTGPLVYRARDNLPFGQAWNTSQNFKQGASCSRWTTGLQGIRLGTTFEIPYASAGGREVTPASARAFGRDLARALRRYIEEL
jgi:hypothetical protein